MRQEDRERLKAMGVEVFPGRDTLVVYVAGAWQTLVESAATAAGVKLRGADCVTDLVAFTGFLRIVDPALLSEEDWQDLCSWLRDEEIEGGGIDPGLYDMRFFLTGPSPHPEAMPVENCIPTPESVSLEYFTALIRHQRAVYARAIARKRKYWERDGSY